MDYRVRAVAKEGRAGFRRDGRFFRADEPTLLTEAELTDAIRDEPQLIVERNTANPAGKDLGRDVGRLQRENAALIEERDRLQLQVGKLGEEADRLKGENATLTQERDSALSGKETAEAGLKPVKDEAKKLRGRVEELSAELDALKKAKE